MDCSSTFAFEEASHPGYVISHRKRKLVEEIAAGKPAKVAITACSRKLLTILNAIARTKQPWQEFPV
ncbi:MAG TPA: hypothetical protein VH143_17895 [Kofleriaceae bacterium]|jgi:hypothetical protein|nr:hypothetical protein [Kofleriaceae bacterium]